MLIIGASISQKTNALIILIKEQDSDNLIDKIYLYAKNLNEPEYQFLIKKREDVGIKHLDDPKAFIEYIFSVPKEIRLNSTHYLIMKIHNKRELQNIATNLSADINYKDFMKICKKCTSRPYSFLTIDTTLPADDSLRFRKNLLDSL